MNLLAVVAVVSNSRALLNEWHRIPLVVSVRRRWAGEAAAASAVADLLFPWEVCSSILAVAGCAASALALERLAARRRGLDAAFHAGRGAAVVGALVAPLAIVLRAPVRPATHAAILLSACVAMMKLLSYAHTNAELRRRRARAPPPFFHGKERRPPRVGTTSGGGRWRSRGGRA